MIFIPFSDPIKIAKILDYKRLGKQRVEAKQILDIIEGRAKSNAWKSHPTVLMWKKYANALKYYYDVMVLEWIRRGYQNNMPLFGVKNSKMPWFMHCQLVLMSHRATLLRKNYAHYSKYFKVPKIYIKHRVLWIVKGSNYLTAEQIKILKLSTKKKIHLSIADFVGEI